MYLKMYVVHFELKLYHYPKMEKEEFRLDFSKLWECDKSPCRFRSNQERSQKRCEDAPHSESTSCKTLPSFALIRGLKNGFVLLAYAPSAKWESKGNARVGNEFSL